MHGPFTSTELRQWVEEGALEEEMLVRDGIAGDPMPPASVLNAAVLLLSRNSVPAITSKGWRRLGSRGSRGSAQDPPRRTAYYLVVVLLSPKSRWAGVQGTEYLADVNSAKAKIEFF